MPSTSVGRLPNQYSHLSTGMPWASEAWLGPNTVGRKAVSSVPRTAPRSFPATVSFLSSTGEQQTAHETIPREALTSSYHSPTPVAHPSRPLILWQARWAHSPPSPSRFASRQRGQR